jgi:hypothetical protein
VEIVTEHEFLQRFLFAAGDYEIAAVSRLEGASRPLLILRVPRNDYDDARYVPQIDLSPLIKDDGDRPRVMSSIVRAGVRHPGIHDRDLRQLHRVARRERHVELFCDVNALTTGLMRQLVDSLGRRCCRVVVSSSSIDILHEYQSTQKKKEQENFLRRAEMSRCLTTLEGLRQEVAVHVHPLPPGTSAYMRREGTEPAPEESDFNFTYISEDRQMVAAFWHYLSTTNPRVPVHLVTTDSALARVCSAERVPFIFAKSPNEVWGREEIDRGTHATPESLWFDPFSLKLRSTCAHRILLELAFVFQELQVTVRRKAAGQGNAGGSSSNLLLLDKNFAISFDPRSHYPGQPPTIKVGDEAELRPVVRKKTSAKTKAVEVAAPIRRRLKLSLLPVVNAMPTRIGQSVSLAQFGPTDEDAHRQLAQIGQVTDLFEIVGDKIVGREGLGPFLRALQERNYVAVNAIFRKIDPYDEALHEAASGRVFPNSKAAGAVTGWAVVLGAAYKTSSNGTLFGLADVSEERFEQAVVQAHTQLGRTQRSVQLAPILDRVCSSLQLSPIRFEALLESTIGKRGLSDFETQRATSKLSIPKHPVIVAPTTAASSSYLRQFDPGRGLVIGSKVVGALVKRGSQQ